MVSECLLKVLDAFSFWQPCDFSWYFTAVLGDILCTVSMHAARQRSSIVMQTCMLIVGKASFAAAQPMICFGVNLDIRSQWDSYIQMHENVRTTDDTVSLFIVQCIVATQCHVHCTAASNCSCDFLQSIAKSIANWSSGLNSSVNA